MKNARKNAIWSGLHKKITRVPWMTSPELDSGRTLWSALKSNSKCTFSISTFYERKCVFKTWGDLSWGIIVLMSLLTQDFCQKSSRSFSFHREWKKKKKKKPPHFQPLRFACSVCSGELKTDAKTDLVPKLLKKAEAPSAEMGHWPKPLDSWNKVERVLKDLCKFQSCLSRNW